MGKGENLYLLALTYKILKKTKKLLFRKGETRFQNAETRFQNAETRFQNAKTDLSRIFFARNWMDTCKKAYMWLFKKFEDISFFIVRRPSKIFHISHHLWSLLH